MSRIDLQVSYAQKNEARGLGARWDVGLKRWYVPDGFDRMPFEKWIPKPIPPNMRAAFWHLATATRTCWRCKASSRVFAIMLPPGYEALYVADDPADDRWQRGEDSALLSYVADVPESVAAQLRRCAPRYRIDFSHTTQSSYWMNHCEHCETKLGDNDTLHEAGTFYAREPTAPSPAIDLTQINDPFTASCGDHVELRKSSD